jgi:hypothetical protein
MIRVLLGELIVLLAGHAVLRLGSGRWPVGAYGPLAAAGLSWLAGVAVLGTVTTLVGVLGGRTTPLPVVAPVLGLLAVAGLLPPRRWWVARRRTQPAAAGPPSARPAEPPAGSADSAPAGSADPAPAGSAPAGSAGSAPAGWFGWPAGRGWWVGELACAAFAVGIGARTLAAAASVPVRSNDEYAMWMLRGRALSQLGHLDPRVFQGLAAGYQHLEYPLVFPSLVAWNDSWAGRPTDAAAHLGVAALLVALLAVVGGLVGRLAGPLAALASVVLVAAVPTMLAPQALRLMADVPVFTFALSLAIVLLCWLRSPDRVLLVAAAALGAGAVGTKVEGLVFTAVAFFAALLLARSGRRWLVVAGGAALLADLPWLAYTRVHGLRSWVANGDTLSVDHVRQVLPLTGRVVRGMADRWPGSDSTLGVLLLVAVVPAAVLAIRAGRSGRLVGYLGIVVLLDALALLGQYVVSAYGPPSDPLSVRILDGQLAVTVFRVALVPAALLMIAVPILAGLALQAAPAVPADPAADPPGRAAVDPAGLDPAGPDSAGPDSAGLDSAALGSAGLDSAALGSVGPDSVGVDQAVADTAAPGSGVEPAPAGAAGASGAGMVPAVRRRRRAM